MDAEIKAKWIEALESGDYQQTARCLRDDHGFCCLGVLCDISGEGEWTGDSMYGFRYMERGGYLPDEIRNKFGISSDEMRNLSELNDGGHTFKEIAQYIEKRL